MPTPECCCDYQFEFDHTGGPGSDYITTMRIDDESFLVMMSGQFSTTIKFFADASTSRNLGGVTHDGTNTIGVSVASGYIVIHVYAGVWQWSGTVVSSTNLSTPNVRLSATGGSWCPPDELLISHATDLGDDDASAGLLIQSGTTETTRSELSIDPSYAPSGACFDGVNTVWSGGIGDPSSAKLYKYSGLVTSTFKDSQDVSGHSQYSTAISVSPRGDTPWIAVNLTAVHYDIDEEWFFLQSGSYSSTVKTSESVTSVVPVGYSGRTTFLNALEDFLFPGGGRG